MEGLKRKYLYMDKFTKHQEEDQDWKEKYKKKIDILETRVNMVFILLGAAIIVIACVPLFR